MTDVLSALLLFAGAICLLDYLESPKRSSFIAPTLITSFNMLIRYEAWQFAAIMVLFLVGYSVERRPSRLLLRAVALGVVASAIVTGTQPDLLLMQ
jgi:hypothetical protein